MKSSITRLAYKIASGLGAAALFSGCGDIVQLAGRPKMPGEESAPSYKTFEGNQVEIGALPEDIHQRAHWFFKKGRLDRNTEYYESGLRILASELRGFYSNPYRGFTNSCDSADMFVGVFEDCLRLYRQAGKRAESEQALHHLDWLSWSKHKLELYEGGMGTNEIERLDAEGALPCFVRAKYGYENSSLNHQRECRKLE